MILDGRYTHASDVWAFGILAYELYKSYTTGQEGREVSVPYYGIQNDQVSPKDYLSSSQVPKTFTSSSWKDCEKTDDFRSSCSKAFICMYLTRTS